jgi:hydroxymethylglutaryl-CoA synthase
MTDAAAQPARFKRSALSELSLVSTTLPFAERSNAGIVAAALGLPETVRLRDATSTGRAALSELAAALLQGDGEQRTNVTNSDPSADDGPHGLRAVVAAERRIARPASPQEMIFGDGAAAALVGSGAAIAQLVAHASINADMVDHFRLAGETHDYGWEERWVRDEGYMKIATGAIAQCLKAAGVTAADVAHFALPAPLARINEAVAKRAGINAAALVSAEHETQGDLGCAQPLAMLDAAVRRAAPGDLILVAAFGSGCDALLLRRTAAPCPGTAPEAGRIEKSYMRYLSYTGQINLEWGMRAEMDNKTALTAAWRDHARLAHFEAGRCTKCATVQFPRSALCVNPACRAPSSQEPVSLADAPAKVLSHTSDFLAYTPNPPYQFGHIDFDAGGRVMMEFADCDAEELRVGLPVRMVYRVKDVDPLRGFKRYFWKATPLRDVGGKATPVRDQSGKTMPPPHVGTTVTPVGSAGA